MISSAYAGPARADDADDALACVRTKVWERYGEGWALRSMSSAPLKLGEQKAFAITLVAGRTYQVLGCATGALTDLDLVLYDAAGKVVSTDGTADAQPVLDLRDRTGAHTLVIYGRRTTGSAPGGAAFAVLHR